MFFSYAKLLFSTNEMPLNLDEKSNAYYRRLLILEMNQIVPKDRKDSKLLDKLLEEANYAIHKTMHSLRQLYLEQEFTESPHSKECIEILYRAADSVKAFTDETLCHKKGEKLKRSEVYKRYEEYCTENGRIAHKKSKFWEYMADKKYLIKHCSDGAFYFIDTAFQAADFVEVDDCMEIPFEQTQLPFYDNNDKNDNL